MRSSRILIKSTVSPTSPNSAHLDPLVAAHSHLRSLPSLSLPLEGLPFGGPPQHTPSFNHLPYVAMDNSALLSRTSSNPLPRLHLQVESPISCELNDSFICSLLVHAHALGLRHLTIDGYWQFEAAIRDVFSISSLESLSIRIILRMTFPSAIALTRLKSLSINLTTYNKTQIEQLLSELCCLEDLQLYVISGDVCLSS
ncbi:hypothetical protein FCM35_KLT11246 [Carex littledalei]|uniref:Uncharacterized protein n=1 Tax=Carex littledalei TaxID=544730 RepID=A0A833QLW1_9POAL|nr:hypothetical protein FCM35_KLT11246 [Carex littledalei]